MNLLMFGCPGVGKGTQATLLSKSLNIPHFATGDILRKAVENKTEAGITAENYMNQGLLVPDEILANIVKDIIQNGFILDGYPRNKKQAEFLFKIMEEKDLTVNKVIYLTAGEDIVVNRMLKRGRSSEKKIITIRKRIEVYKKETLPVLDMFPSTSIISISSVGDENVVNDNILLSLKSLS